MIIQLDNTTTTAINKKLNAIREQVGAATTGRVLTLIIALESDALLDESIEAAYIASQEHPSRVIAVISGGNAGDSRLDAEIRMFGDAGASEVVVLRLYGPLADHADAVVVPFLLPDIPVVAWWPDVAPASR